MFTYFTNAEPNSRRQNVLRLDYLAGGINNIADQDDVISEESERFQFMQQHVKPAINPSLPRCCYQTEADVDARIDHLKSSLKIMRSCKAKKRAKTCGTSISSSHAQIDPKEKANVQEDVSNLGASTKSAPDSSPNSQTLKNTENEMFVNDGSRDTTNARPKRQFNNCNLSTNLPDRCLLAVEQYLYHYGKGTREVEEYLGAENVKRLNEISVLKNAFDSEEILRWDIMKIVHALNKCQYDAKTRNQHEIENICYKILQVIRTNYYNKEYLMTKIAEILKAQEAFAAELNDLDI